MPRPRSIVIGTRPETMPTEKLVKKQWESYCRTDNVMATLLGDYIIWHVALAFGASPHVIQTFDEYLEGKGLSVIIGAQIHHDIMAMVTQLIRRSDWDSNDVRQALIYYLENHGAEQTQAQYIRPDRNHPDGEIHFLRF